MSKVPITHEAFAHNYAERSGITVEELIARGYTAIPCYCDYELCEGWQMMRRRDDDGRRR